MTVRQVLTAAATIIAFAVFLSVFSWQVWIASIEPRHHDASANSNQHAAEEIKPKTDNERIALYTELLAWFTGLLALVSSVQGFFLFRADRTARITAEAARDTASHLGIAADLAEKQMLLAGRQADLAEKQHAIGRMQFISTHRPLLRVRYFILISNKMDQIAVRFTVANIGSSEAKIEVSRGVAYVVPPTTVPLPSYEGLPSIVEPYTLPPGATAGGAINGAADLASGVLLRVYGYITYKDILDNFRTTAFCRQYNTATTRFEIVDDPNIEYED